MTTIVVGTGYTGLRLLYRLPATDALGLTRSPPPDSGRHEIRSLELDSAIGAIELPPLAQIVYTVPPAADAGRDRRLEAFLAGLSAAPARIVYLSTTGVYGDHGGRTVTEDTPVRPESERAARRVAAENALHTFGNAQGTEITILRVPGIYGPDRLMIERVRDKVPVIDDAQAHPGNRIHVDDLVTACLAAVAPGAAVGIFNVGDGDTRTPTWFASEVARQLGWPVPPTITRERAEATWSPVRMSFFRESRVVDTLRMRQVLGVTPRYTDAADGIRASLLEMGLLA